MARFKKISDYLFVGSIILFGLYPLVPERQESYVPITLMVSSLLIFIRTSKKRINYKPFIVMSSVFVLFAFSAILSENTSLAFRKIETMASLIAMPIVFFIFLNGEKVNYRRLQLMFSYSFFCSNIVFSLTAFYLLNYYRNPKFAYRDSDFFRNAITDIPFIGNHSIYVSLFLAVAIIIGVQLFLYEKMNNRSKFLIFLGMSVLATMLILLMSKGVLIGLTTSLITLYIFKKKYWLRFILVTVLLGALILVLIPKQNNRFAELINKQSFEKVDINNSTSVRFFILKSAFNLCTEKPLFGYGLGDVQGALDKEYKLNNLSLPKGHYNSHNQYLFVWLSSGVLGIFLFLFYLFYVIKIAITKNDYLLLSIAILYIITFLFENVLSRQSGAILFAFLINLLVVKNVPSNHFYSTNS